MEIGGSEHVSLSIRGGGRVGGIAEEGQGRSAGDSKMRNSKGLEKKGGKDQKFLGEMLQRGMK